jgi:ribosomal protein S18 acetylase RimI-like enzyme
MTMSHEVPLTIRPIVEADAEFLASVTPRLYPGATVSPRDPESFRAYFDRLTPDTLAKGEGAVAYVAEANGAPVGVIAAHLDVDYFTNHSRLYVDTLAIAIEAEGRGIGRALLEFIEDHARQLGCREVVLDVFAENAHARRFYEKSGYAADYIRMAKSLVSS